jgi:alpha-mannosidase
VKHFVTQKIAKLLWELESTIRREVLPIDTFRFTEADPPHAEEPEHDDPDWRPFRTGESWGGYDVVAWFRTTLEIPEVLRRERLALRFVVGPRDGGESTAEALLYVDGEPLQAIDVWHEAAWLPPELAARGRLTIALRAWSGVLGVPDRRRFVTAELLRIDPRAETLWHRAHALLGAVRELDERDWRRERLLAPLERAVLAIDFARPRSDAFYESVGRALEALDLDLEALRDAEPNRPTVLAVGHSHIDLAWLWRQRHTREKAARTFSTVLHLMREYPEYRFMHSSPQLYRWLEHDHPALFERVRGRVRSGEWEATGAMWVEPDTNLVSGESLVRQLLWGRRYFRETFGVDSRVLWLPDVFGYSAILPQILAQSGIRAFITTKLSWSQCNRFPHDTFRWRGIDGSEVLTYFVTTPARDAPRSTYNGELSPWDLKGAWERYRQQGINHELLMAYGWGDGGGGPTREMLETARVMRDLPGFPRLELGHVEPFCERLERRLEGLDVPVWDGELYLEYHRGTYTSQAQVKWANRRSEELLREAEWLGSVALALGRPDAYPDLREAWELVLYNQFHDILPGSSIRAVYEDTGADYQRVEAICRDAIRAAERCILGETPDGPQRLAAFNALSEPRGGVVTMPADGATAALRARGQLVHDGVAGEEALLLEIPTVPALGYRVLDTVSVARPEPGGLEVAPDRIESSHYRLELDARGRFASLYDKTHDREVLQGPGNVLQAFQDKPLAFDAWDIDPFFEEVRHEIGDLQDAAVEERGPLRGSLRLAWRFRDSKVTQRITLYRHARRIDLRTEIDWRERQVLVKAAFPVRIRATRATYDLGWGVIERPTHRNTSWDWARFEVPAHRWVDLSEGNYGVALLNDGKYGHDVHDATMRLTLLKSSVRPDPQADRRLHRFTYSLLPHAGDWRTGQVAREAADLNVPLRARATTRAAGRSPDAYSFAHVDAQHVLIDTVKRAEDGDGLIVRVVEIAGNRHERIRIRFGHPLRSARLVDCMEDGDAPLEHAPDTVAMPLAPFEIRTLRVRLGL